MDAQTKPMLSGLKCTSGSLKQLGQALRTLGSDMFSANPVP